jgi:hypothetical protein
MEKRGLGVTRKGGRRDFRGGFRATLVPILGWPRSYPRPHRVAARHPLIPGGGFWTTPILISGHPQTPLFQNKII